MKRPKHWRMGNGPSRAAAMPATSRAPGRPSKPAAAAAVAKPIYARWDAGVWVVMSLWLLFLFDPHVWIANLGLHALKRVTILLYVAMLGLTFAAPRKDFYGPLLLWVLPAMLYIPFMFSPGVARDMIIKILLLHYVCVIGTIALVKTADQLALLLWMFAIHFVYWGLQGLASGRSEAGINWHPDLANSDAFGPVMVVGFGFCLFFGQKAASKKAIWFSRIAALVCAVGVVASFARGAFLALAGVGIWAWLRSPNKLRTAAATIAAIIAVMIAANIFFPGGAFWTEMSTITAEGTETGTGRDRMDLWTMAYRVWTQHPILGVGAANFGRYAFAYLPVEQMLGAYALNPGAIFGRALHSIYVELLVDYGLVGCAAYLWIIIDFWRRNLALRKKSAVEAWASLPNRGLDLKSVATGLECAMLGFLINGIFYYALYYHWFFSILALNATLHYLCVIKPRRQAANDAAKNRMVAAPAAAPA